MRSSSGGKTNERARADGGLSLMPAHQRGVRHPAAQGLFPRALAAAVVDRRQLRLPGAQQPGAGRRHGRLPRDRPLDLAPARRRPGARRAALRLHLGGGVVNLHPIFVAGALTFGYLIGGVFFVKFWRRTHDVLFLAFAAAFGLMAVNQAVPAIYGIHDEALSGVYLL